MALQKVFILSQILPFLHLGHLANSVTGKSKIHPKCGDWTATPQSGSPWMEYDYLLFSL